MRHVLDEPVGWTPPRLAEIYDETSFWSARFGALLCDHLEIRRGVRGLDVGCGTGFPLLELAHLHGTNLRYPRSTVKRRRRTRPMRRDDCSDIIHRVQRSMNPDAGATALGR